MKDQTRAVLDLLNTVDWFSSIGTPTTADVKRANSWEEAIKYCQEIGWENAQIESRNELSLAVWRQAKDRFQKWNDLSGEIREISKIIVHQKTDSTISEYKLTSSFVNDVSWDVVLIALSAEYADIYVSDFYIKLACWYVKGHFPCGWEGVYPQGRLIVF